MDWWCYVQYFANPSTPEVREAMMDGRLGCIETPKQGNKPVVGAEWCADNGCFGKGWPGTTAWLDWLKRHTDRLHLCAFATLPDVVGDAKATLARSLPHADTLRSLGYPVALVAQDGLENLPMPWDNFDVLFIGGTTEWKLGPAVRDMVGEARSAGKRVHMGRVNSLRRLRYADAIGCDTADGTHIIFSPSQNLPKVLGWLREVNGQEVINAAKKAAKTKGEGEYDA